MNDLECHYRIIEILVFPTEQRITDAIYNEYDIPDERLRERGMFQRAHNLTTPMTGIILGKIDKLNYD